MVYPMRSPRTIYGVSALTKAWNVIAKESRRADRLNFLLFATGIVLGCLFSLLFRTSASETSLVLADGSFLESLLGCGRFLCLLLLLAFVPWGAGLVPPLFGAEGAFLGSAMAAAVLVSGATGALVLAVLLLFRLVLVIPYGFLLGSWAVSQSLRFPERSRRQAAAVCCITVCVILAAAFLECTVAHWLGGYYFLKFGVSEV